MTLVNTFGAAYTRLVWDAVQVKTIYLQFCAMYCCNWYPQHVVRGHTSASRLLISESVSHYNSLCEYVLLVQMANDVVASLPLHSPYFHSEGTHGLEQSDMGCQRRRLPWCGNCITNGKSSYRDSYDIHSQTTWSPSQLTCILACLYTLSAMLPGEVALQKQFSNVFGAATFSAAEVYGFDPQCHQALFPLWTKVGREIGTGYEINGILPSQATVVVHSCWCGYGIPSVTSPNGHSYWSQNDY